jgi:hypothetical protein
MPLPVLPVAPVITYMHPPTTDSLLRVDSLLRAEIGTPCKTQETCRAVLWAGKFDERSDPKVSRDEDNVMYRSHGHAQARLGSGKKFKTYCSGKDTEKNPPRCVIDYAHHCKSAKSGERFRHGRILRSNCTASDLGPN